MGSEVLDTIIQELKSAKVIQCLSISTPNVTHSDQLTLIVRYVLPTGPKERFLRFLPMIGHTGQVIAEKNEAHSIHKKLGELDLSFFLFFGKQFWSASIKLISPFSLVL